MVVRQPIALHCRTCASRTGDESIARIPDLAHDKTDPQSPLLDPSLRGQFLALDRSHVLDLQVHGREILAC